MLASVSVGVGALAACAPRSTALLAAANVFWVKQHTYFFRKNTTSIPRSLAASPCRRQRPFPRSLTKRRAFFDEWLSEQLLVLVVERSEGQGAEL